MDYQLLIGIVLGVALLLFLILRTKLSAFISLLIASMFIGLFAGLDPTELMATIQKGMGGTLGFVATVVGLGALFGAILEHSGGAKVIAQFLLSKLGTERAPLAMSLAGFIIAIPVFFDVAFIILIPMLYSIQRKTKKSLLLYAIPLLAGLAATHAFIPPTPGPIAVADILGVGLGEVILVGFLVGLPAVLISGLLFGKHIAKKIHVEAPSIMEGEIKDSFNKLPKIGIIISIIAFPIVLILINTTIDSGLIDGSFNKNILGEIKLISSFVGHPFTALILANLLAWYLLGRKQGYSKDELLNVSNKSFAPAGTIILLTGAGGVLKQVLVDTGGGKMIASALIEAGIPILLFAFIAAALVRIIQGSATTAMLTAAGLVAPLITDADLPGMQLACITIAIAAGASIFSHVNDSGFWLVSQYLNINEKQTFRSWTVMTTILAFVGFSGVALISIFV
ncbi:gluconate:H+ symporter [Spongiivirga sp. MCCC 1A20706]|uniref:GntP family permease n=1 Tax=Spongiivirga sp. MCCC 1A20706 TaxID=3160963 RepID=UPI0039779016